MKKVKIGKEVHLVVDIRPVSGDHYIYLSPKEWVNPPKLEVNKANWPKDWLEKCWDKANYWRVDSTTDILLGLPLIEECEECSGKGEAIWSCCTQERVDEDYARCPKCGEGLGEEKCQECDGKGYVPIGWPNEPVHIVDPIGAAEAMAEAKRDWIADSYPTGPAWTGD